MSSTEDFGPRSRRFTKPAYEHGGEIDLRDNNRVAFLVARRTELKNLETAARYAAEERSVIDEELIALLGNADRGLLRDGGYLEAPVTHRLGYAVKPTMFRTVKIKKAKDKAQDEHEPY
jgi:hypothetical protein